MRMLDMPRAKPSGWLHQPAITLLLLLAVAPQLHAQRAQASTTTGLSQDEALKHIVGGAALFESFDGDWASRWQQSADAKYNGRFEVDTPAGWLQDVGLRMPYKNRYYGLARALSDPVSLPTPEEGLDRPLVLQYEVKYSQGVSCGGAYVKLLTMPGWPEQAGDHAVSGQRLDARALKDTTPYSIMFGPDKCGSVSKVHLILRHRDRLSGAISEKHLTQPPAPETSDHHTHVYTLLISSNLNYYIMVDGVTKASGNLTTSLEPPLTPPRELPDPSDTKPRDWVDAQRIPDPNARRPDDWDDRERIPDPTATKPAGWLDDAPLTIPDPDARKPAEWDDDEDGTWQAPSVPNPKCKPVGCGPWSPPLVRNPAYKGIWTAPLNDNPEYKGEWVQRMMPNPHFYEDDTPLQSVGPIGGLAFELWTTDTGYVFDNVLLARDARLAKMARDLLWKPKHAREVAVFEAGKKTAEEQAKQRSKSERKEKRNRNRAARGRSRDARAAEDLADMIIGLFEGDKAPLAFAAGVAAPLIDMLDGAPQLAFALVTTPFLLVMVVLYVVRMRQTDQGKGGTRRASEPQAAPAPDGGEGRTTDKTGDAGPSAGGHPEGTGGTAPGAGGPTEGREAVDAADGADTLGDVQGEEPDDDDDGDAPNAGVRHRTRRAD